MRTQGRRRLVMLVVAAVAAIGPLGDAASAAPPDEADFVQEFTRDVYERVGANLVNPDAGSDPNAALFSVNDFALATAPGDPVTWAEWSAATAASRASTIGGPDGPRTDVRISLRGLIPNGLYSIFWQTTAPDSVHPLCPGVERLLPLDAVKADASVPDPSSFVADSSGEAEFHGRIGGDLLAASQVLFSIIYHADGKTYYPLPNKGEFLSQGTDCRSSFGLDALRQLQIGQKW